MRAPMGSPLVPLPRQTRGAGRRRRLQRAIGNWNLDRDLCAEYTRRLAIVTLTTRSRDPEAALGRARDFWHAVRRMQPGARYFCWLELQADGTPHYHAIWLNPPNQKRRNLLAWVTRTWQLGRTQVRFRDARGGMDWAVNYALKYASKMGKKAYQQRYDNVPRGLRTFMSQRLEIPPDTLREHQDRDVWCYVAETVRYGQLVPAAMRFVEHLEHVVPAGGKCSAIGNRRAPRASPRR